MWVYPKNCINVGIPQKDVGIPLFIASLMWTKKWSTGIDFYCVPHFQTTPLDTAFDSFSLLQCLGLSPVDGVFVWLIYTIWSMYVYICVYTYTHTHPNTSWGFRGFFRGFFSTQVETEAFCWWPPPSAAFCQAPCRGSSAVPCHGGSCVGTSWPGSSSAGRGMARPVSLASSAKWPFQPWPMLGCHPWCATNIQADIRDLDEQLGTVRDSGQERHWTVDMYHKCIIHQCERSGRVLILGVVRLFFLQNNITVWEPDESTRVLHLQRTPETSEKSYRISSGFMCHGWNIPDLYMTFQVQYINIGV